MRAFVANENAWSFLPVSRQQTDAELWMSPSDDEAHAATNENYQGFGTMRITHQPAPASWRWLRELSATLRLHNHSLLLI